MQLKVCMLFLSYIQQQEIVTMYNENKMNKKYINVIKKERFTKDNIKVKKMYF